MYFGSCLLKLYLVGLVEFLFSSVEMIYAHSRPSGQFADCTSQKATFHFIPEMSEKAARKGPTKAKLTVAQVQEAKGAFESIDTDKNGVITVDELTGLLSEVGEEPTLAPLIVAIWDEDGDRRISFDEFLKFYEVLANDTTGGKQIFDLLFKKLDKNGDGELDVGEMQTFGELIGVPVSATEAAELIRGIDKDGSGTVSYPELLSALGIE
jgi:Ca2+-binding EF-hand superfamily protein